jgi:hypothetical protein
VRFAVRSFGIDGVQQSKSTPKIPPEEIELYRAVTKTHRKARRMGGKPSLVSLDVCYHWLRKPRGIFGFMVKIQLRQNC